VRRALSCPVCYLLSLAGHLEQHGREFACLVGAQAVPTTSDVDRVPVLPLCVDRLFLIEPNTHLDRAAVFVAALGRHVDLGPLMPDVNTVPQMVMEVLTACDAPRRARLVITPGVVLRGSHDRTVLNVVANSSNSSHMADHGTESDPSAVSLPSPDANMDKRGQTWQGDAVVLSHTLIRCRADTAVDVDPHKPATGRNLSDATHPP
jgi:hypothetical protein